jgi:folylpolyglutamate synthase/dihydrofolate synthase
MINPGLGRIQRLLTHLPAQSWPAIHVAGTNGKGSICAYLTALFQHHASTTTSSPFKRIGRFTSPHLLEPRDSVSINGQAITQQAFSDVSKRIAELNATEGISASEFEQLTASALDTFAKEKVDLAIVECGMGGRLDATNVLKKPIVTVVTRLGLDHQAFLGDTPAAIAMEKSGIMKRGIPCVVDSSSDAEFLEEVTRQAKEKGASLVLTPRADSKEFLEFFSSSDSDGQDALDIPHVAKLNMWTAYLAFSQALTAYALPVPSTATLLPVLTAAPNPGRHQILSLYPLTGRTPSILVDGAHNPQAFKALLPTIARIRSQQRALGVAAPRKQGLNYVTWVLACTSSRDPGDLLKLLPKEDRIIATTFSSVDGMPWVTPLPSSSWKDLLAASRTKKTFWITSTPAEALDVACREAKGGPLVVAGSLYLVADVLRLVRDEEASLTDEDRMDMTPGKREEWRKKWWAERLKHEKQLWQKKEGES